MLIADGPGLWDPQYSLVKWYKEDTGEKDMRWGSSVRLPQIELQSRVIASTKHLGKIAGEDPITERWDPMLT